MDISLLQTLIAHAHERCGGPDAPWREPLLARDRRAHRRTAGPVRVSLDRSVCIGAGQCVTRCSAVFDQSDDDGLGVVVAPVPDPRWLDAVRDAARFCPTRAIRLVEEPR